VSVRPLPTLLGLLILLAGVLALTHVPKPLLRPPQTVRLEALPQSAFRAVLLQDAGSEVRSREVSLRAADTPAAQLEATLRALRAWLLASPVRESAWPPELGAPQVFWLEPGRAVLDFSLEQMPNLSVASELRLLGSIRQTAARQGVDEVFILIGGEAPPTFLGQVALPQVLEP
jgi:hypothetical protein